MFSPWHNFWSNKSRTVIESLCHLNDVLGSQLLVRFHPSLPKEFSVTKANKQIIFILLGNRKLVTHFPKYILNLNAPKSWVTDFENIFLSTFRDANLCRSYKETYSLRMAKNIWWSKYVICSAISNADNVSMLSLLGDWNQIEWESFARL